MTSLILLVSALPGTSIFDQSAAAYKARRSFSVEISLDARMNRASASARYRLSYLAPDKVLLTKLSEGKVGLVFWLNGTRLVAYDPLAGEMVARRVSGATTAARLAKGAGTLDDPVTAQLSSQAMTAYLVRFRGIKDWSTSKSGDRVAMVHFATVKGKRTRTELDFSSRSKLLTRMSLVGPDSRLEWAFHYGAPPARLSFGPPPGTRLVSSLAEHAKINAADPRARTIVDQTLRAYSRLTSIAYSVSSPDGPSDNWMDGRNFCEKQAQLEWSYRNGTLEIHEKSKKRFYRGKCGASAILTYLKILKSPMDPVLQALVRGQNPISGWFMADTRATDRGTVKLGGITASAIELNSDALDVSLLIRSDNGLVASASSRTKNGVGGTVFETQREFRYWSVNRPIPSSSFKVEMRNALPLSAIGKS